MPQEPLNLGLYGPAMAQYFEALDVTASLAIDLPGGTDWHVLFESSRFDVRYFEFLYGKGAERGRYNALQFRKAWAKRTPIWGTHNGFCDLFVPILGERPLGHLVCGPFAAERLDGRTIEKLWKRLSGHAARSSDAEFLSYARAAAETLPLDDNVRNDLERFGACYARVLSGRSGDTPINVEFRALHHRLLADYPNERMWRAATGFVDRYSNKLWTSTFAREAALRDLGLSGAPTDVIAFGRPRESSRVDPVQEMLSSHALHCECVNFARLLPGSLAGRTGEGVCLLVTTRAKLGKNQRKRELYDIAERMRTRAQRRLGLTLRAGISSHAAAGPELPAKYDEALVALQSAQHGGVPRVFYEELESTGGSPSSQHLLRGLKEAFAQGTLATLRVAIDGFQREVIARGHGSIEATKAYLDSAISELLELIERRASIETRTLADLRRQLADEMAQTMVLQDLAQWFAFAVPRLFEMSTEPARASQKERLERARGFIDRNYREPLTLRRVAKEAGFQPVYFCTLFKQRFEIGFEHYLLTKRLEAAQYLLRNTGLSIHDVALESGFSSYPHLGKAFKRATNTTPMRYRRAAIKDALQPPQS